MTTRDPFSRDFPERPAPPLNTSGGGTQQPVQPMQQQQHPANLTEKAKDQTRSFIDGQRERAAEGLGSLASTLRQTSHQFQGQNQDAVAQYTERGAEFVDRASEYLRTTDLNDMLVTAERYARREPAMFLGGAFALGFLGARFLKSSRRHEGIMDTRSHTGYERTERGPYATSGGYDSGSGGIDPNGANRRGAGQPEVT